VKLEETAASIVASIYGVFLFDLRNTKSDLSLLMNEGKGRAMKYEVAWRSCCVGDVHNKPS
jgi:hypothetical protein